MKTSDKELDELFNAKLNNLEVVPDDMVWDNISDKLNGNSKKKSIIPILSIAATLLIMLSVGLFWLRPNGELVKKPISQKVVKLKVKAAEPEKVQSGITVEQKDILLLSAKNKAVKEASPKKERKAFGLKLKLQPQPGLDESLKEVIAQNKPQEQQLSTIPAHVAIVPDASVALKIQPAEMGEETVKPGQVLAASTKPKAIIAKRKGIRNMGDLVNLVMAKVDKRQDKLIEFTDNDDGDESNITGINLGIITIKKEK